MRVIVNGAGGRMGKEVMKLVGDGMRNSVLAAAVDVNVPSFEKYPVFEHIADFTGEADVIIDFSFHTSCGELCDYAVKHGIPMVIATTGHTDEEKKIIEEASKSVAVFMTANYSVGVALLCELAVTAAKNLPDADIEIVEKHHNRKMDAPSGTALLIADCIKKVRESAEYVFGRHGQGKRKKEEIGIHALRLGNIVGEHEVIISTDNETLTLKHEARSRALFAEGAVAAADFIKDKPCGMYGMSDMIG